MVRRVYVEENEFTEWERYLYSYVHKATSVADVEDILANKDKEEIVDQGGAGDSGHIDYRVAAFKVRKGAWFAIVDLEKELGVKFWVKNGKIYGKDRDGKIKEIDDCSRFAWGIYTEIL